MEVSSTKIESYKMQSSSIKQQNVTAQYNSMGKMNNSNKVDSSKPYQLSISYEGKMAQVESKIYEKIQKNIENANQKNDASVGETKKMESFEEFYSPEKVAERITDFARSLFPMWLEQNQKEGQTNEDAIKEFMDIVNSGVEEGFNDAKEILKGFGTFDNEDKKSTFDKTYDLTKARLNDLSSVLLDDIDYIKEYLASKKANEQKEVAQETSSQETYQNETELKKAV